MRETSSEFVVALHFACLCGYDIACLAFSADPTVRGGYFLVPVAWALLLLAIPMNRAGFILLTLTSIVFQAIRTTNFFISGGPINFAFFYHLEVRNLVGLLTFGKYLLGTGLVLTLQVALLLATAPQLPRVPARWRLASLAAALPVLYVGPVGNFIHAYRDSLPVSQVYGDAVAHLKQTYGVEFTTAFNPRVSGTAPPKNLIFIFLEGMETNYLDEGIFPGLSPGFRAISRSSLHASNLDQKEFTGFTIGGMFAALCGIPFVVNTNEFGNDMMDTFSIDHLPCLGTVLDRLGYRQTFLQGSDAKFSGLTSFYSQMRYDEIIGMEELAKRRDFSPRDEPAKWGYHDGDILRFARKLAESYHAEGKPFNLTVATIDTHHTGFPGIECPRYDNEDSVLRAVHCLDALVAQFVDEFRASPLYRDTVLVLMGDHLAMRPPVRVDDRRIFASFLGASVPVQVVAREASHFDVAPTILELLGIQGVHYPLSSSLLGAEKAIDLDDGDLLRAFRPIISFHRNVHLGRDGFWIAMHPPRFRSGATYRPISFANGRTDVWPEGYYHLLQLSDDGWILDESTLQEAAARDVIAKGGRSFILSGRLKDLARYNEKLGSCGFGLIYIPSGGTPYPYVCAEGKKRAIVTADLDSLRSPDAETPVLNSLF